jgi:hypothetical protein
MDMIETIRKAWSWIGLDPAAVVASNAFGNVIVRATDGAFWRIRPEDLACEVIARSEREYEEVAGDEEFVVDWEMSALVHLAREKLGPLEPGHCYCLKMPGVLGGAYDSDNLATISRLEAIAFSGDLAEQIKDLPDGARIELRVVR